MTLIEALKSGRRFRNGPNETWLTVGPHFTLAQILDDQWEVESVAVTITRETLAAAWDEACAGSEAGSWDRFCRELGL